LYLFEKGVCGDAEEYSRGANYLHESTSAFIVVSESLELTVMEDGGKRGMGGGC
jgi:hypothetical protein